MFEMAEAEEWGGYMGDVSSRELAVTTRMSGLQYVPDLGPVGANASYYPRDTSNDAAALNYLGYYPQDLLEQHVGTSGSLQADQASQTGAWDPMFRQAVTDFQIATGLTPDGWIGPSTRTRLAQKVAEKNAKSGADVVPFPVPPVPVPNIVPGPGPQPAAATSNTGLYVGLGVGALALVGLGAWALSK